MLSTFIFNYDTCQLTRLWWIHVKSGDVCTSLHSYRSFVRHHQREKAR